MQRTNFPLGINKVYISYNAGRVSGRLVSYHVLPCYTFQSSINKTPAAHLVHLQILHVQWGGHGCVSVRSNKRRRSNSKHSRSSSGSRTSDEAARKVSSATAAVSLEARSDDAVESADTTGTACACARTSTNKRSMKVLIHLLVVLFVSFCFKARQFTL